MSENVKATWRFDLRTAGFKETRTDLFVIELREDVLIKVDLRDFDYVHEAIIYPVRDGLDLTEDRNEEVRSVAYMLDNFPVPIPYRYTKHLGSSAAARRTMIVRSKRPSPQESEDSPTFTNIPSVGACPPSLGGIPDEKKTLSLGFNLPKRILGEGSFQLFSSLPSHARYVSASIVIIVRST